MAIEEDFLMCNVCGVIGFIVGCILTKMSIISVVKETIRQVDEEMMILEEEEELNDDLDPWDKDPDFWKKK